VPQAAAYPAAGVNDDTATGVIQRSMPTARQVALLDIIRRSLQPEGEATRLILHCWHAGGISTAAAGGVCDQALIILDRRYSAGPVVLDTGGDARRLYELSWPSELSIEAYNIHFNKALSLATKNGPRCTPCLGKSEYKPLEKCCPGRPFEPSFSPSSWPASLQHDQVRPARRLSCGPVA
jgi:hypothetical protein